MELDKLKKLHRYAAIMAALFFVAGFIKASFHDGNASVAADVWLFGLSVYLPFYVLYSEGAGVIQIPYGGEIRKDTEVVGFRLAQGLYSIGAIAFFLLTVGEIT
tara:strand:+ start:2045 stop:2356 length:312 start_codon:yes stop_codon:yes gene_type:complete